MSQDAADKGGRKPLRIGKYEVIAHIATGGMGAVYKARDVDLDRVVALKILSPDLAAKPLMVKRFFKEARSAAKLRHENIVGIYDFGNSSGTHFLALEFVDGIDLHEFINRKGKLDAELATNFLTQAVHALDHAFGQNIVHRDIKPSNFLITQVGGQWRVKLTDMGLAREVREDDSRVTKAGTTIGTVDYMAPEQARNSRSADVRSDIYSLGCTLYHMLAGNCPFPRGSLAEKLLHHLETEAPDISALNAKVPARLAGILKRMLAKKPEDRFQTPAELLQALEGKIPVAAADTTETLDALRELAAEVKRPRSAAESTRVSEADEAVKSPSRPLRPLPPRRPGEFRDEEETLEAVEIGPRLLPSWWPYVVGAIGLLVAGILVLIQLNSQEQAREGKPSPAPPGPAPLKKKSETTQPPPKKEERTVAVGPEDPGWPLLFVPTQPLDRQALSVEFGLSAVEAWAPDPAEVQVIRVRRAAAPAAGDARSIAEAWLRAEGKPWTIIEIHDQGPLFEKALPPLQNANVWIRAGNGYRPLIAWDGPAKEPAGEPALLFSINQGGLVLDQLDLVVHAKDLPGDANHCLINIHDGAFRAGQCTFSQAGKRAGGLQAVRLTGSGAQASPACRLHRCYIRGNDLTAVGVQNTAGDVTLDGCLVVGNQQPLVYIANRKDLPVTLKLVRSTLCAGSQALRWQGGTETGDKPHLHVKAWDVLLARTGPGLDADMIDSDGIPAGMTFRAINCLYAGWQNWLKSPGLTQPAGKLADWHKLWGFAEGDEELPRHWPRRIPSQPEELPAADFTTQETLACYAATVSPGMLGCEIGALPGEPVQWLARTYERFALASLPLPETQTSPPIPAPIPGVFQGGRVDLTKVDLGKHLAKQLAKARPGPKVVLHLTGSGKVASSRLHIKDIPHLVLYFEPGKDKSAPLTLAPHASSLSGESALIDIENSKVEIVYGFVDFTADKKAVLPAHMIRLRGGALKLADCRLQGPMTNVPEHYKGLIHLEEAAPSGEGGLVISDSLLASARTHLDMKGVMPLRSKGSVWIAPDSAVAVSQADGLRQTTLWTLENNTFAVGKSLVTLDGTEELAEINHWLVIQAQHNCFLDPFKDEPRQASLLRCPAPWLSRGCIVWQGQNNAFDRRRLQAYVTTGADTPERQEFPTWRRFWGPTGEREPLLVDVPSGAIPLSLSAWEIEALALPAEIRPGPDGTPVYGADLRRLELTKQTPP